MWICVNDGFYSIVDKARNRRRDLMVRARRPGDLERLFKGHAVKVLTTPDGDYRYRADVPRALVGDVLAERARSIAYGNFKDSVADAPLHGAYNAVWGVMGDLQPGGPYNAGNRSARQSTRAAGLFDFDDWPMPEDHKFPPAEADTVCEGCVDAEATCMVDGENLCAECAARAEAAA